MSRLRAFLRPKNPEAASRATATIRKRLKILESYPEVGRPIDDVSPDIQEWSIAFGNSGYIALYRFDGREVVILAVRHARELGY